MPLPQGKRASVTYRSPDRFTLDDTLNFFDGKFTVTGSGYIVASDVTQTGRAYAGTDPRAPGLFTAMRSLAAGAKSAEVGRGQLSLQAEGYVFTFDDAGPAAP